MVSPRRLIALDIDGTLVNEFGHASPQVREAVRDAIEAGHEVMLATGRSPSQTFPVAAMLGLQSKYLVCSNGAMVYEADPVAVDGYSPVRVETFDPSVLIDAVEQRLTEHAFAVEDEDGIMHHTAGFPEQAARGVLTETARLRELTATRLVVVSHGERMDDMLAVAAENGLHRSHYSVGLWSWLDIAPRGVNKATALEWVRQQLDVPRESIIAIGDGENDIEMLEYAAGGGGLGVAMGHCAPEVAEVANEQTGLVEDGVAQILRKYAE